MEHLNLTFPLLLLTLLLALSSPSPEQNPIWIKPYIIDYRNGTVVRDTTTEPPSFVPPLHTSHVQSKDITATISSPHRHTIRARVYIPARPGPAHKKLPILVYFHGGAFCIGSPFDRDDTVYLARVSAEAHVIVLSPDYTLYPDGVVPVFYDDAWAFLQWAVRPGSDPWVARFGDTGRVFVGGDSAGGNIAHNMAVRAGSTRNLKLRGAFLAMPYFLGSRRVGSEPEWITESPNYKVWGYVCPECKLGVDDPYINPGRPGAPRLSGLGCERMMVYVAEVDELRARAVWYYQRVKESGWPGRVELIEAKNESHVFHILKPEDPATAKLIRDLARFLNG